MTSPSVLNYSENVRKLICRQGPFSHPDFEPSMRTLDFIRSTCKILVLGAGGLGCEILKNLAMMNFWQLHVIDMDTIELSNLNRQFLFRKTDIGKPKAEVAASFLNNRISGCNITPHYCRLEDLNEQFYRQFHLIVSGLDSISARRWMNTLLLSQLKYDLDDNLDYETIIPFVDGGTEGFKGNTRVIIPGITACYECTIDLYPPQINYPLCTIANTPRLPEHCIEYARLILWSKENPFECNLDTDNPQHLNWINTKAHEYAKKHGIKGVTYSLTKGVTKNIIPAVASTNAAIAALISAEAFKIATNRYTPLNNYMIFNDLEGIYTYEYEAERKPDCLACGRNVTRTIEFENERNTTLKQLIAHLINDQDFQLKSPGLMAQIDGVNRTLYLNGMADQFSHNLTKTLYDLGLRNNSEISVLDATVPNSIMIRLRFSENAIDDY